MSDSPVWPWRIPPIFDRPIPTLGAKATLTTVELGIGPVWTFNSYLGRLEATYPRRIVAKLVPGSGPCPMGSMHSGCVDVAL